MINVNVNPTVSEIPYKGEKSCKFIISGEEGSLLGTITTSRMKLADKLVVGKKFNFTGYIKLFKRFSNKLRGLSFTENTFYVTDINEIDETKGEE